MKYTTIVGLCTLELSLDGVQSLKQKRSAIKPLLARLHSTFNISAAEVGYQDVWQSSAIAIAVVTGSTAHANEVIQTVVAWVENHYPDLLITRQEIEIL